MRRVLAAVLFLAAVGCGGSDGKPGPVAEMENPPFTLPPAPEPAPAPPEPAPAPGSPPEPEPAWRPDAAFYASLQTALDSRPSDGQRGLAGSVANPFPPVPGAEVFELVQAGRATSIQVEPDLGGRLAYCFTVGPNDWSNNGLRAEFHNANPWVLGERYRVEWDVYFPTTYPYLAWDEWTMFMQVHSSGFPTFGLHTAGGYLNMTNVSGVPFRVTFDPSWLGHWNHFKVEFALSTGGGGVADVFVNDAQMFRYRGKTVAGDLPYNLKYGSYHASNPFVNTICQGPMTITKL